MTLELFLAIVIFLLGFVYLLIPKRICYKLIERDAKVRERHANIQALGIRRHRIEVRSPKAAYVISKISAFILAFFGLFYIVVFIVSKLK